MKLKLILPILSLLTITNSAFSLELTPVKKLKMISADQKTDLTQLSASLMIQCEYKQLTRGNIFKPIQVAIKPCGQREEKILIDSEGNIVLPALTAFEGTRGTELNNYSLGLYVRENKTNQTLFSIKVDSAKAINKLLANKEAINIYKVKVSNVKVSTGGQDFFATDLKNEKSAALILSFPKENWTDSLSKIALRSQINQTNWVGTNPQNSGTNNLLAFDSLSIPEFAFARLGDQVESQDVSIAFMSEKTKFKISTIQIPLTVGSLESLSSVELK